MRALWLPDVLRDAGLTVRTYPGWETRGRETWTIGALIAHDTVAGTDAPRNRKLLADGRAGLAGPLAQLGGEADGSVCVIASGRANHNGYGRFANNALGWETYCYGGLAGKEQPWNTRQVEAFVAGAAAIRAHLGPIPVLGHKESDPRRKIDPYDVNMDIIRGFIQSREAATASVPEQEEEMELIQKQGEGTTVVVIPSVGPRSVDRWDVDVDGLKRDGVKHRIVSPVLFDRIVRGHDIYST